MRFFRIEDEKQLVKFDKTSFKDKYDEKTLEDWLENAPNGILEDSDVLVIGRQVRTSLDGFIDLLGIDRQGDLVVIELKRDKTPRDKTAQALEYAAFVKGLDEKELEDWYRSYKNDQTLDLAGKHRDYFELQSEDIIEFNRDQRMVIVGQDITPAIKQTALFLGSKGVRVTCVEFTLFQTTDGDDRLITQETVVDGGADQPRKSVLDRDKLIQCCDKHGKAVYSCLLDWSKENEMNEDWGYTGCTIRVPLNKTYVGFLWLNVDTAVYPVKQYVYFGLKYEYHLGKTAVPAESVEKLWKEGMSTGFFTETPQYLKCQIKRKFTDSDLNTLVKYCASVVQAIHQYGLK